MDLGTNAERMLKKIRRDGHVIVRFGHWQGPSGCGRIRPYGHFQFRAAMKLLNSGLVRVANKSSYQRNEEWTLKLKPETNHGQADRSG